MKTLNLNWRQNEYLKGTKLQLRQLLLGILFKNYHDKLEIQKLETKINHSNKNTLWKHKNILDAVKTPATLSQLHTAIYSVVQKLVVIVPLVLPALWYWRKIKILVWWVQSGHFKFVSKLWNEECFQTYLVNDLPYFKPC